MALPFPRKYDDFAPDSTRYGMPVNLVQLYLSPRGRIRRRSYWLCLVLPFCLLTCLFAFIESRLVSKGVVVISWEILAFWPALAVSIKRWHDRNKSGWWTLIVLVPLLGGEVLAAMTVFFVENEPSFGLLILGAVGLTRLVGFLWTIIECGFLRGTSGENQFGPEPSR